MISKLINKLKIMPNLLTYINNGELVSGEGYSYMDPKTQVVFSAVLDGERGLFIFNAHGEKHEVKSPTKYVAICTPSYQANGWLKVLYNGVPIHDLCKSRRDEAKDVRYVRNRISRKAIREEKINLSKKIKTMNDQRGIRIEKLLREKKDMKEKYSLLQKEYTLLQKNYKKLCVIAVDNLLK